MQFLKECVKNDQKLIRRLVRPWFYKIMRFQYYELSPIRLKMMSHCYLDKQEMLEHSAANNQEGQQNREWKWVFHVKEERPRRYSRFWKVNTIQEEQKAQAKSGRPNQSKS